MLGSYSLLEAELRWFCYSWSLYIGGECSGGGLLGSSSCSVEISALMFCSMVLLGGGVGGSAGVFAAGVGGGGGLVSVPCGGCEGFVLKSASYLRFSATCDATYIYHVYK